MSTPPQDLKAVVESAREARAMISWNRGHDKHLAREAYESMVFETVGPLLPLALKYLEGDISAKDTMKIAELLLRLGA